MSRFLFIQFSSTCDTVFSEVIASLLTVAKDSEIDSVVEKYQNFKQIDDVCIIGVRVG